MAKISLELALVLVNAGGWHIQSGRITKNLSSNMVVTSAEIKDDTLVLYNGIEAIVSVNIERLSALNHADRPHCIYFDGPFMVRQQRKKIDGGGWHEVEEISTLITLVNTEALAQYKMERYEQSQRTLAAAQINAEEEQRRFEVQRDARILTFLTRQKELIADSRVVNLIVSSPHSFTIAFDNGHVLNICPAGEFLYDVWLNVEGGDQSISLDNGENPDF